MYEQAVQGVEIRRGHKVVMVGKNEKAWLAYASKFDWAVERLSAFPAVSGMKNGQAYAFMILCSMVGGDIATVEGQPCGDYRTLVAAAVNEGLIDEELAADFLK